MLRFYSYLFHLVFSLFLIGVALLATISHQNLNLGMLPFSKRHLLPGVYELGLIGILLTVLAIRRRFKLLFPLWAAAVAYILIRGFFFSAYSFTDRTSLVDALWLIAGALVALIGAVWTLKPRRGRLYS